MLLYAELSHTCPSESPKKACITFDEPAITQYCSSCLSHAKKTNVTHLILGPEIGFMADTIGKLRSAILPNLKRISISGKLKEADIIELLVCLAASEWHNKEINVHMRQECLGASADLLKQFKNISFMPG